MMKLSPAFQRLAKFLFTPMDRPRDRRGLPRPASATRVSVPPSVLHRLVRLWSVALFAVGSLAVVGIGIAVGEVGATGLAPLPRIGWLVTASSGTNPFQAVDGSVKTCWSTAEPQHRGQTFDVDMGHPWEFDRVTLNASATPVPRNYQVFISDNARRWHKLDVTCYGQQGAVTIVFPKQLARYFRVRQTGSNRHLPWSIYELNVYNDAPFLNKYFMSKRS